MIRDLKIIQHNTLKWARKRRNELSNYYQKEDPDVISLNSTGIPDEDRIRIFMYDVYQKNTDGEENEGVAIAIKRNINHQLIDDFASNFLAVKIDTRYYQQRPNNSGQ